MNILRPTSLVVIQAVRTADVDELPVAELARLGATEIAPAATDAVATQLEARRDRRIARWTALAGEAARSVGRPTPTMHLVYRAATLIRRFQWGATGLLLQPDAAAELSTVDLSGYAELVLVVGAGDILSDEQHAVLSEQYVTAVRLERPPVDHRAAAIAAARVLADRLGLPEALN